jgi:ATP-dependent DNA helicase RecQ
VTYRGTLARTSLTLSVVPGLSPLERYAWIADALEQLPGSGIIYVLTVAEADKLAAFLASCGYNVDAYTGQLDGDSRVAIEDRLRHNEIKAVVATSALGMGYDKPDLGFCVHVGSPSTPVAYYQQVGRAGRAVAHADGVLLPSDADERIWDYFATASIPDPKSADKVLAAIAEQPRTLLEIESETGLRRGRLEALLKILAVEGVVEKVGTAWAATGERYVHNTAKWDDLTKVRATEADIMRKYAHGEGCLMAFLQIALDDPTPAACGRCSVCTGNIPFPGSEPSHDKLMSARAFMRGTDAEIEPRKKWPSGVSRKGNIIALNAGRAVAFADDPGWSVELGELARSRPGEIPQSMLDGAVATLKRWSKVWDTRPTSVVALPAADMRSNVQLAEHIAQIGKLPLHDIFSWTGSPAPDDAASTPVVAHLEKAIQMKPDFELPRGPVLLVSTEVRTRWTATVAGALLREAGASGVLLLTVHQRP